MLRLLGAVALWGAAAVAATPSPPDRRDVRFTRLTSAHGLSHDHVWSIVQDRQGFLWFGTEQGGLNRFDGSELKVYRSSAGAPRSLSHDFVWVLYVDRAGTLWAGTNGGGLNRYDRERDDFVSYRHDPGNPRSLPHDNVKALHEDARGTLWVGTDGGLSRHDPAAGAFVTHAHDPRDAESLSDSSVRAILEQPDGRLWLGTRRGGINVFDPATGRCRRYRHAPGDPGSLVNDAVAHLLRDRAGRMWVATSGGLDRFVPEGGRFVHYRHDPRHTDSLSSGAVTRLHEDRRGRLWVATLNGLDRFEPERGVFYHYRHNVLEPESLGDDAIRTLYEDDAGALWIGTVAGGVSRADPEPPRFTTYRHDPSDPRSMGGGGVQAVHFDRSGALWVGTTKGLYRREGAGFVRYADRDDPSGRSSTDVRAIAEDGQGALWIGTGGAGLARVEGGGFRRYPISPNDGRGVSGDSIDALHASPRGGLWIAVHGVGLDYFDGRAFTHYRPDAPPPRRLPTRYVLHVFERPAGVVWLATNDSGLLRLDVDSAALTRYPLDPSHPTSERDNRIHVIHPDTEGALWLGTDSGLVRFDPAAARYTHRYTAADGLAAGAVVGAVGDDHGRLWLATAAGLSGFDPRARSWRNLDRADGLQASPLLWRAHAKSPDGRLFFGGAHGLTVLDPSRLVDNPRVPPVVLTRFELFGRAVGVGGESPLREAIHVAREVTLRHDQSSFGIRFAALDYASPHRNRYAYRLEGFEDEWREAAAGQPIATYTNLDPGRYVFRAKGSNGDGVWNEAGAALRIAVRPPWWGTWWFRGACVVLAVGVAAGALRLRVRTLEERERRFRSLADNAPDAVVRFDRHRRYLYVNPAVEGTTGLSREAFLGKTSAEVGLPGATVTLFDAALGRAMETGRPEAMEFEFPTPDGNRTFQSRLVPERGAGGTVASVLVITRDVTGYKRAEEEVRASLHQKDVLLKELHHRVKNNLQIISSLLHLQSQTIHDETARAALHERQGRVRSMALIHERLFLGRDVARIDADEYLRSLISALFASYGVSREHIEAWIDVDDVTLSLDTAIPCGLLVNELVSNALKHAFPGGRTGTLHVELRSEPDGRLFLRVSDDGVGLPAGLDFRGTTSLGLQLVISLAEQLEGTVEKVDGGGGTSFEIRFSEPRYRDRV